VVGVVVAILVLWLVVVVTLVVAGGGWWLLWFLVVICLFLVDLSFSSLTFLKPLLFVQAKQLPKVWCNYVMTEQWPLFCNYFGTPKLQSIFSVFLNFNCKWTMLLFNGMHGLEVKQFFLL